MTIALIILAIFFALTSGFAKAICDLSEEGKLKWNPFFWHKNIAWKNKWKNGDKSQGEKFFGSSCWFVGFTDAWHLFGYFYNRLSRLSGIPIGILAVKYSWWYLLGFIVQSVIYAASFHIFHTYKILRK